MICTCASLPGSHVQSHAHPDAHAIACVCMPMCIRIPFRVCIRMHIALACVLTSICPCMFACASTCEYTRWCVCMCICHSCASSRPFRPACACVFVLHVHMHVHAHRYLHPLSGFTMMLGFHLLCFPPGPLAGLLSLSSLPTRTGPNGGTAECLCCGPCLVRPSAPLSCAF